MRQQRQWADYIRCDGTELFSCCHRYDLRCSIKHGAFHEELFMDENADTRLGMDAAYPEKADICPHRCQGLNGSHTDIRQRHLMDLAARHNDLDAGMLRKRYRDLRAVCHHSRREIVC